MKYFTKSFLYYQQGHKSLRINTFQRQALHGGIIRVLQTQFSSIYIYIYIRLPGKQEIRGSIPGRGTTDFVRQFLFVYIYKV